MNPPTRESIEELDTLAKRLRSQKREASLGDAIIDGALQGIADLCQEAATVVETHRGLMLRALEGRNRELEREVVDAAKGWLARYEEEVRDPSEEAPCKRLVAALDALSSQPASAPAAPAEGMVAVLREAFPMIAAAFVASPHLISADRFKTFRKLRRLYEDGFAHKSDCAVHNGPAYERDWCDCGVVAIASHAQPNAVPPAHTDHPLRHWDRTCPACIAETQPTALAMPILNLEEAGYDAPIQTDAVPQEGVYGTYHNPDDLAEIARLKEPKPGILCGNVAISTDPRYAGWIFVRHADGENWTTCAKMTPETWAMLAEVVWTDADKQRLAAALEKCYGNRDNKRPTP